MVFGHAQCFYPTAPFISPQILKDAALLMEDKSPDEIIGVVGFSYLPQRCYSIGSDGLMEYKYKEYISSRSQDLEKLYHDAGQFYLYNTSAFLRRNGQIEDGIMPMVISPVYVQDIDTYYDWLIAEAKYSILKKERRNLDT